MKKRSKYHSNYAWVIEDALFLDKQILEMFLACNPNLTAIKFDSRKEAKRYLELRQLERAGVISNLSLQPSYDIVITKKYRADFLYIENGDQIVEDSKGFKTDEYITKRKFFRKQYPHLVHRES